MRWLCDRYFSYIASATKKIKYTEQAGRMSQRAQRKKTKIKRNRTARDSDCFDWLIIFIAERDFWVTNTNSVMLILECSLLSHHKITAIRCEWMPVCSICIIYTESYCCSPASKKTFLSHTTHYTLPYCTVSDLISLATLVTNLWKDFVNWPVFTYFLFVLISHQKDRKGWEREREREILVYTRKIARLSPIYEICAYAMRCARWGAYFNMAGQNVQHKVECAEQMKTF